MIFVVFLGIINQRTIEFQEEKNQQSLKDLGDVIKKEIDLATKAEPGYSRTFNLPPTINSKNYSVAVHKGGLVTNVVLKFADFSSQFEYVVKVPHGVFAQGIGHTLEAWWTTGRTAAAQYRASISTPPEGFFGRVQYHLRHGWQYGAPNPFARVLQDNPVIIDNQFTRAVREWREVRELGNAARTARRVAAAHPDIAALAESAEGVQRVFARAEFLAPEAGMVTRAVYRSLAAVSTRVVGGALGTWQILRSPRKLAFAGQFSSITAALGVLGIMIMEGGRDIPEEVVDRVSRRSFVNILPNIPTRFAFAVAGLPVYTWDFFLGNMLTTSPELNMVAQQGTYSKKKAGEYAGAIRRATDGGEKARNYCYLMQALRIADARQPAEWTALTDQEIVALEIEGVHPTRGMAILLDAAAKWKNGETLTPEEVDQFPDILVKSGVITEEQLAGVRYDSTPFAPTEYAKRLPVDIHTLIQTAHGHRAAIDARKRERGMK
ncbi:MAG: hypothetical protein HYY43_01680 [Deltaproteobacteria bacterium]|nr:hypothetical protein [Deltaproteobacteria bacterium]